MLALLFALSASAGPPPLRAVPAHVVAARQQVDWSRAGDETVALLSRYLAVDTRNPPGNESLAAAFLADFLDGEGIAWETVEHAPGRESLIARIPGAGTAPPLCLMHHTDVVTWEPDEWTRPALDGVVEDGVVWGRGALDMKGMGALELMTLALIARNDVPLARDVVLLAVADEEVDNVGARQLVAMWDRIGCSHMLNEGGLGLRDALFEGQTAHAISVAEKGILWVRMHATGRAGHGSVPYPDEAPDRLLQAMKRVERYRSEVRIDPAVRTLLANAGRHRGGITGAILRSRVLVNLFVRPRLKRSPATAAAIQNTVHLTGTGGAEAPNVVPSAVWAQYDCRLLPGKTPEALLDELRHLTRKIDGIEWEVVSSEVSNGSDADDPLYEAVAAYAVEGDPHAFAGPVLSVGFTDSLYVRPLGVRAYGYMPFEVTEEEAGTMHGHDEGVSVDNVHDGLFTMFSIVVDFAGR